MRDEERREEKNEKRKKEKDSLIFTNSTYNSCIMTIRASRVVYSTDTGQDQSPNCRL